MGELFSNLLLAGGSFVAVFCAGIYLEKRLMQRLARKH